MNLVIANFFRSVRAESFKIKKTPILWIVFITGLFSAGAVFLLFIFIPDELVSVDSSNPWFQYFEMNYKVTAFFFLVPYIVLLNSSIVNVEHNSNAWKFLYSLPLSKGTIYFSKLFLVVALVALTHLIFYVSTLLGGFLLSSIQPVYGFGNYSSGAGQWAIIVFRFFITVLGLIALQYWLSVRFKNYIIPIGIGMIAFVIGILTAGRGSYELLLPHTYCMNLGKKITDQGTVPEELMHFGLIDVEWYSLLFFVVYALVGYIEQRFSNVK